MPIQVRSEIGTLEQVLLHRPGAELEQLVPGELERLLFDDIPYLKAAQQEHDAFAALLRQNGTEVLYLEELMAQTLAVDAQVRRRFIRQFIDEGGRIARHYQPALYEYLAALDDRELVRRTMTGVSVEEFLPEGQRGALVSLTRGSHRVVLDPYRTLYFTRGIPLPASAMVSASPCIPPRRRETIYGQYILKYHPDYAGQVPPHYRREDPLQHRGAATCAESRPGIAGGGHVSAHHAGRPSRCWPGTSSGMRRRRSAPFWRWIFPRCGPSCTWTQC